MTKSTGQRPYRWRGGIPHLCADCGDTLKHPWAIKCFSCRYPKSTPAGFWAALDKSGECWLWVGSTAAGYGTARLNGRTEGAHRVAWTMTNGPIPEGMLVCHTCDVKLCCRPDHLFLGTHLDNNRDCSAKGRHRGGLPKRTYRLMAPGGEIVEGAGVAGFCREHGLNRPQVSAVLDGRRGHHKGWRLA